MATTPTPEQLRDAQKALRKAELDARKEYSTAVSKAKTVRDSKIAQAYHAFAEATGTVA